MLPLAAWLLLAAPGCSWLLLAAPGCSWLLLAAPMAPRWDHGAIAQKDPKKKKKKKSWKNTKSIFKFLGRFRGLGGLGLCGNHRKRIELRACKIWSRSVPGTSVLRLYTFLIFSKHFFWGSRRWEPPPWGHNSDSVFGFRSMNYYMNKSSKIVCPTTLKNI